LCAALEEISRVIQVEQKTTTTKIKQKVLQFCI